MSRETKNLDVSSIDFDGIRTNLKDFLRSQDTLQDYDFEGSAISTIVDLLSYVTHMNAVNANLGINETFLDTAQFRGSVVGHARQLGYTPRSATAPVAYLNIQVNNPSSDSLTLPRGQRFKAKIGNDSYNFVTDLDYSTSNATFDNVRILQGNFKTVEFVFDAESNEKLIIPDPDADTSTLKVEVFDSRTSSTSSIFTEAKKLTTIKNTSLVYFLAENPDGLFEITFGDGVLGQSLENGNLVRVEYLVTKKAEANGASVFALVDPIEDNTNVAISIVQPAAGGDDKESIESVRYAAPLSYASQNRAVVPKDFEGIILENFADVSSAKVWGGEDNDPPVYGKVFVSAVNNSGTTLSEAQKATLLRDVIGPKSVLTITPEFLDPEFLNITMEAFFKYDPSKTNLTVEQLEDKAKQAIEDYNTTDLSQFDRVFRYSQFLNAIDGSDPSILNSFARIYLSKRFVPTLNIPTTYTLNFSVDLYRSFGQRSVIYESSTFRVNGVDGCRFKDFLDDTATTSGRRRLSIVSGFGDDETVVVRDAGFIEGSRIVIEAFAPEAITGEVINIEAIPSSYDIVGTLNNVVRIDCDCSRFNIQGEVDTIVSGRDYSGVNYQTFSRDA